MQLISRICIVSATVIFSHLAVAREALLETTIKPIQVTHVAAAVQEQLDKASPEERKRFESAIHTGNLFISQYFSGNAYDSDPENKDWEAEVAPLIELDREQWNQQYGEILNTKKIQLGNSYSKLFNNEVGYSTRLTCPKISLIAVQKNKEDTTLLYRTTSVGSLVNYQGNLYGFNLEGSGAAYDVRIELDQYTTLVTKVVPADKWLTWSYTRPIAFMNRFLTNPVWFAGSSTKEHTSEMVRTYKSSIQTIAESAAKICK